MKFCCLSGSPGHHNHPRSASITDHPTGWRFSEDRSTTKAVRRRMENMKYYLRGEVPPIRSLR